MIDLPKFHGTDLPLHETAQVAWTQEDVKAITHQGRKRVIRRARIYAAGIPKLMAALSFADELFGEIAEGCGGVVVDHSWGLAACPSDPQIETEECYSQTDPVVAAGYALVADVEVIRGTALSIEFDEHHDFINAVIHSTNNVQQDTRRTTIWADRSYTQWMLGQASNCPEGGVILADIEPRFIRRNHR